MWCQCYIPLTPCLLTTYGSHTIAHALVLTDQWEATHTAPETTALDTGDKIPFLLWRLLLHMQGNVGFVQRLSQADLNAEQAEGTHFWILPSLKSR